MAPGQTDGRRFPEYGHVASSMSSATPNEYDSPMSSSYLPSNEATSETIGGEDIAAHQEQPSPYASHKSSSIPKTKANTGKANVLAIFGGIGALVAVIGLFIPYFVSDGGNLAWSNTTKYGGSKAPFFSTLALGVVAIIAVVIPSLMKKAPKLGGTSAGLLQLIAGIVTTGNWAVNFAPGKFSSDASRGTGFWLIGFGGILLTFGGLLTLLSGLRAQGPKTNNFAGKSYFPEPYTNQESTLAPPVGSIGQPFTMDQSSTGQFPQVQPYGQPYVPQTPYQQQTPFGQSAPYAQSGPSVQSAPYAQSASSTQTGFPSAQSASGTGRSIVGSQEPVSTQSAPSAAQPQFTQGGYGTPAPHHAYERPHFGQPAYGAPDSPQQAPYGQPQFGQPQFDQPFGQSGQFYDQQGQDQRASQSQQAPQNQQDFVNHDDALDQQTQPENPSSPHPQNAPSFSQATSSTSAPSTPSAPTSSASGASAPSTPTSNGSPKEEGNSWPPKKPAE